MSRRIAGQVSEWDNPYSVSPSPAGPTARWLMSPTSTAAAVMQENGVLNGSPVFLPSGTIEEIGLRITVAGSAGALIRLGVYALKPNLDGVLLWDAGTIDGTSATTQTITGGAIPIKRGWYALVAACQGNPGTRPTIYRNTGIAPYTFYSQTIADGLASQSAFPATSGIFEFSVTGALPASTTFGAVDGSRSAAGARVGVKGTWT